MKMKIPGLAPRTVDDVLGALSRAVDELTQVNIACDNRAFDLRDQAAKLSAEARSNELEAARAERVRGRLQELLG